MFKYQILVQPLGMMYGSAGGFLSPENLVGRAGSKFPPEAAALAGLFFSANYFNNTVKEQLKKDLFVAGPFWVERSNLKRIYVPIPWSLVIGEEGCDRWSLKMQEDELVWQRKNQDLEPDYTWQPISGWDEPERIFQEYQRGSHKKKPWVSAPILHPQMQKQQRCVLTEGGLFLENTVQVDPDIYLVYLSTHKLNPGLYRFGGESHLVEIKCIDLKGKLLELLQKPIERTFALITPAVWGSNRFSYRYPRHQYHPDFPKPIKILTDKPIPYRYSAKGRLGRGRYAVPAGSVFVLEHPIGKPWWDWNEAWFPKEGFSLKHLGCGLCLPIDIPGLPSEKGVA